MPKKRGPGATFLDKAKNATYPIMALATMTLAEFYSAKMTTVGFAL